MKILRGIIILLLFSVAIPVGIWKTVENSWFLALSVGVLSVLLMMTLAKMTELVRTMDKVLEIYYKEAKSKSSIQ